MAAKPFEQTLDRTLMLGTGRMGQAIRNCLLRQGQTSPVMVNTRGDAEGRPLEQLLDGQDWQLAWEFTVPPAAPEIVRQLLLKGVPTVSGSTGWDVSQAQRLADERQVAFMHAANFSLGIALMRRLVKTAGQFLRGVGQFEACLLERHHRAKLDQPSGTAKVLLDELAAWQLSAAVASFRQGTVPGEHAVYLEGLDESIEIVHRARSREIFADGAVLAGAWLVRERPRGNITFDQFLEGRLK